MAPFLHCHIVKSAA